MRVTMRFRALIAAMRMLMMWPVRMHVTMIYRVMFVEQLHLIFLRPDQGSHCCKQQDGDTHIQRSYFYTKTDAQLPCYRVRDQPRCM